MPNFPGFVGPAYSAPSIYQDAQELINWFVEVDIAKSEQERGYMTLYPTEGLTLLATIGSGPVRALYVPPGGSTIFIVSGTGLYKSTALGSNATLVGTLSSGTGPVSITDNGLVIYLVDGANRYSYNLSNGTFTTLPNSDGAFQGATRADYVDDYIVYNNPNTIQWGCTNALSNVSSALNFSSKDSSSDNLVTLIADHRQVLLIGENTTEQWINAGTFPFPFQRIPGASMQHGCIAPFSVTLFGESTAWLARDPAGGPVVIQMFGYHPIRISNHAVENDISGGVLNDAIAFRYRYRGHEFYFLTFPTQDKTWVYDLEMKEWHKRAWRDSFNVLHRHRANCFANFQNKNIVGDWQNGNVYSLDPTNYTDNGAAILRIRRAPHVTQELDRVYHTSFQVQFEPGVGLATGQGSNPQCMLRWSNDGGSTYTQIYFLTIGKAGQYAHRAYKKQLGLARDRIYEVSVSDPINAVIVSAEIEIEKGDY